MNLSEFKDQLTTHPDRKVAIALPDGSLVPAHYHVTEVGHVAKKFVDCGGKFRSSDVIVLQTYFGSPADDGHRLHAGRLAQILGLARPIIPSDDLPVEIEYEDGVISQYPLAGVAVDGEAVTLQLGSKHTDCLAKAKCSIDEGAERPVRDEAACCAGSGCCG